MTAQPDVTPRRLGWPFESGVNPDVEEADLRDVSSAVTETCSALSLSLREGDVLAAKRLFGFLVDQIPDRRLVLADVFRPLVVWESQNNRSVEERQRFFRAGADLLLQLREPVAAPGVPGVLLVASGAGVDALTAQMVALLLDDARVPATVLLEADDDLVRRRAAMQQAAAVGLAAPDAATARRTEPVIRSLRAMKTAVVLVGDVLRQEPGLVREVGASAGAWRVGEAADMLLHLRGPLTSAESEVLRLAADGYTNWRISHELGISVSAVKARLEGSYLKLSAADRTHAVAISLRQRWIR